LTLLTSATASAQAQATPTPPSSGAGQPGVTAPPGYAIGADDVLTIVFWREKEMSGDVVVRPDGKISLPLVNDIQATGLTPDQLRASVTEAAKRFVEEPSVTVVVKQINSRKVFITGQVGKPGSYPLSGPTTVLQLLAMAGGLLEYADSENVVVLRTENGEPLSFSFNYNDVVRRRNLKQNIELRPGDTVVVP
jgi:polysaccharide export outer membrane protein